jgi:tetratricopeptide (TPR) repeat protein
MGAGDKKEALRRLAEGDKRLKRGDRHAERGNIERAFVYFEAALVDYQAAYAAYSDPQIFFPIAQAEQRLGRFVDALQHYQELLAESKALSPALRNQVQIHLDEVRKNLAAVFLEVDPPGATIYIDGKQVGRSPMTQPVFIEPGQHGYSVSRSGYETSEGRLDLPPGKEMRKRIQLERSAAVSEAERRRRAREERAARLAAERRASEVEVDRPSPLALWIGVGLTGAFAVGGTVTGFAALSKHGTYADESRSLNAREEARRDGRRLASITDILLGGAVVAGGVTTYYYFVYYRPRAREAERAGSLGQEREARGPSLRFAPMVGPDGAGLAVSGSFW